jgi:hypothetical protein
MAEREHEEIDPSAFVPVDEGDSDGADGDIHPDGFAAIEETAEPPERSAPMDFLSALADGATFSHAGEIGNWVADHMPAAGDRDSPVDHSVDGMAPTYQGSRHEDFNRHYADARDTKAGAAGNLLGGVASGVALGALAGPARAAQAAAGGLQGVATAHGESDDPLTMLASGSLGAAIPMVGPTLMRGVKSLLPDPAKLMAERAFKAVMGKTSLKGVRKAGYVGGPEAVGRTALDEGIVTTGSSMEQQAARAAAKRTEAGQAISQLADELDAHGAQPNTAAIADRIRQEVIEPLKASAVTRRMGDQLEAHMSDVLDELDQYAPGGQYKTFRDLWKDRSRWDDLINHESSRPFMQQIKAARRVFEREFGDQAEAAAGGQWRSAYQGAKKRYSHIAVLDDLAKEAVQSKLANRAVSLSDYLAGGAGAGAGATVGGPLGAVVGSAASTAANKLLRERGSALTAGALYKAGVGQPSAGVSSLPALARSGATAITHWAIQHVLSGGNSGLDPDDEQRLTAAVLSGDPQKLNATHFLLQSRNNKYQKQVRRSSELASEATDE